SFAYQGQSKDFSIEWVCDLNRFAVVPDIVFLLDLPLEAARKRVLASRRVRNDGDMVVEKTEYFEEKQEIQRKCREMFLKMANKEITLPIRSYEGERYNSGDFLNTNFIVVDASASINEVSQEIITHIEKLIDGRLERKVVRQLEAMQIEMQQQDTIKNSQCNLTAFIEKS
ncbi:MAG: hypothetical protein QW728_04875, partial [Thermoplasmata archaeon]